MPHAALEFISTNLGQTLKIKTSDYLVLVFDLFFIKSTCVTVAVGRWVSTAFIPNIKKLTNSLPSYERVKLAFWQKVCKKFLHSFALNCNSLYE